ncbi:MAG: hypothetical protein LUH07_03580 [Lachnospiraceae bacterium]|nr:hypothetical protein [Lachnospiraceae bacterium]
MSEVLSIFFATLMGFNILKPVHLLWINLVTDCLPALAAPFEFTSVELSEYLVAILLGVLVFPIDTALSIVREQIEQLQAQQDSACEYLEKVTIYRTPEGEISLHIYPKLPKKV